MDEEHCDRRLTSHINLIDLAGSECCSTAQTTGERLKVNQDWKSVAKDCLQTPKHPTYQGPWAGTVVIKGSVAFMPTRTTQRFAHEWVVLSSDFDCAVW